MPLGTTKILKTPANSKQQEIKKYFLLTFLGQTGSVMYGLKINNVFIKLLVEATNTKQVIPFLTEVVAIIIKDR